MIGVDARANKGTRAVVVFLTITLVVGVALLGRLGYQLLGAPTLQLNALKQAALPPTAAATATPVPAQPTSPAPGVAAAPTADPCANAIRDGSLEEGTAWSLVETVYSAAYIARPATYVSDPVRAGSRALRLGIDEGTDRYSYSSVQQAVTIPADAAAARLSFWMLPRTADGEGDAQVLLALKEGGGYDELMWRLTDAPDWQHCEISLEAYRG